MNHPKQIIVKDWAFKSALLSLSLLITSRAQAFEYQDYEKRIKTSYSIQNVIEKFPKRELEDVLRNFIASGRPSRMPGSSGHSNSRDYIEAKLKTFNSTGATSSKQEFSATNDDKKSFTGVNLVWEKKGATQPDEILYLTAYYDTKLIDSKTQKTITKGEMPGADNNGTGVSALLSMIEIFNKLELPKTVKIVFLDSETVDAQGSKALAQSQIFLGDLNSKKVNGLINVVMIGHDTRTGDIDKKGSNMKIYTRSKADFAIDEVYAQTLMKAGSRNFNTVNFTVNEENSVKNIYIPETLKSFSTTKIPVVSFSQNREGDLNPRLWTSNDFVETLNINTYLNVFKYVTSAALSWNYDIVK